MSVNIGIIGLAKSGKTTIFNALTRGKAATEKLAPHLGIAEVPEPRLQVLANMLHPKRVVSAEVRYLDIGAATKGWDKAKGIGGQLLTELSNTDALISIVRAFTDDSIPHTEGSVNARRDMATLNLELAFSDLAIIERRLERIDLR